MPAVSDPHRELAHSTQEEAEPKALGFVQYIVIAHQKRKLNQRIQLIHTGMLRT
jgi:hypothetical protein